MPYKDKEKRREWLKQYRLEHKEYFKELNKQYRENGKITFTDNYDLNLTGKIFESLEILECIDEKYEKIFLPVAMTHCILNIYVALQKNHF